MPSPNDPLYNIEDTPEVETRDQQVLDYRPDLTPVIPPATSEELPSTPIQVVPVSTQTTQDHLVNILATYHDVQLMTSWFETAQGVMESSLSGLTAPIAGSTISKSLQNGLINSLGAKVVQFSDVQYALANPNNPNSINVLLLWEREMYSYNGRVDGSFYSDIYHYNNVIIPQLQTQLETLLATVSFVVLGADASGVSTDTALNMIAAGAGDDTVSIDPAVLAPYIKMQNTIASMNSEVVWNVSSMQQIIAAQSTLPTDAYTMTATIGSTLNVGGGGNSSGLELSSFISTISSLLTLYQVLNSQGWLTLAGIINNIDNIINNIVFSLLGQVASMLMHVEGMLVSPILTMIRTIDTIYSESAGIYNPVSVALGGKAASQPQALTALDKFGNTIATMLEGIVGKYEQKILDFYRHAALHNNLVSSKTTQIKTNNATQNLIKVLQQMVAILQGIQAAEVLIPEIAIQVQQGISSATSQIGQIASIPTTLATVIPSSKASINTIVNSSIPTSTFTAPGATASTLLNNIRSL